MINPNRARSNVLQSTTMNIAVNGDILEQKKKKRSFSFLGHVVTDAGINGAIARMRIKMVKMCSTKER